MRLAFGAAITNKLNTPVMSHQCRDIIPIAVTTYAQLVCILRRQIKLHPQEQAAVVSCLAAPMDRIYAEFLEQSANTDRMSNTGFESEGT